ncbi:hypothetical protein A2U01_0105792, partial [Trifolium medium]|nr:hypothetical protein [Trifolium medium]
MMNSDVILSFNSFHVSAAVEPFHENLEVFP